ncbi:MAG: redoxin family protein [Nanoarchaeota archaeon]|nr:redoxin family protein [Nanoarchaeota archaeon]
MRLFFRKKKAPELTGVEEAKKWINSDVLSLEKLRGKVVLLDFWTYSCVNCIRTLPALKDIWEKYKNKRFVIIGVHTPEFEFEKEIGNVKFAVKKHGIKYPVVNDPDRKNWNNYGDSYWPRAALINAEGEVIFDHIGEGGYDEIEKKIIEELVRLNEIDEESINNINDEMKQYDKSLSKETYLGTLRTKGFNSRVVCKPGTCNEYIDIGRYEKDKVNLQGQWNPDKEFIEFEGKDGYIALKFYASEVNLVLSGIGTAEILLDGAPLNKKNAGKDIYFLGKKSYVKVEGDDMYNLVNNKGDYIEGILKIIPFKRMKAYVFSFG